MRSVFTIEGPNHAVNVVAGYLGSLGVITVCGPPTI
jgi:hypothetical protein